ncbi:MAG: 30S ribosomal protein S9 [Planctomycetales bacterium]|nr:30S ribosomal protein S9 [Planctomycetales bacterium]
MAEESGIRDGYALGTGRRKTSVARVRVRTGDGKVLINKKPLETYFTRPQDRANVTAPLEHTGRLKDVDVFIRVSGGGITGQAGACKLGLARALVRFDGELEEGLRDAHMLTRDGRMTERKKYGLRGARKATQFSKR